jgi:hypothetical protein
MEQGHRSERIIPSGPIPNAIFINCRVTGPAGVGISAEDQYIVTKNFKAKDVDVAFDMRNSRLEDTGTIIE